MWNDSNPVHNDGGFMDSSMNTSMTSGNAGSSGVKRGDHCMPVMIGHLNRATELEVWGVPAKLITVVAIVTKIEVLSTKVTFEFKDETGTINGIKWISSDITYESPVKINSYARVYGNMRSNNSSNFILVFNIQPLEELNELMTHLMEVTLVSLEGEKRLNCVLKNDQNLFNNTMNNNALCMKNEDDPDYVEGLNKEQNLVLTIIKKAISEYGAERDEIKTQVPPYMKNKVDEILEFLSAEGHIYTTSTDDLFKHI